MKFLTKEAEIAALQLAIRPIHNQLGQKAYWFKLQMLVRTSGVLPAVMWFLNYMVPGRLGPRHAMLIELLQISTAGKTREEIVDGITTATITMQAKGEAIQLCQIFEMCAEGERTDEINPALNVRT